jgi:hypothetical protein
VVARRRGITAAGIWRQPDEEAGASGRSHDPGVPRPDPVDRRPADAITLGFETGAHG